MLKTRLIPILYIKNGLIVRSEKFDYHQNLGNVVSEANRYSEWNVDELIYIDITRDGDYDLRRDDLKVESKGSILELLEQLSKVCFMPLAFGGRIKTLSDIQDRLDRGADKITLNTMALENPEFVEKSSNKFGKQCIVVSLDYRIENNIPMVYSRCGSKATKKTLWESMDNAEKSGAGELLINSIDRDGMALGYDIDIIKEACDRTNLPLIAAGGAGEFFDFVEVAENTRASGIAAGNIFHFTENAYPRAKKELIRNKINVRPSEIMNENAT